MPSTRDNTAAVDYVDICCLLLKLPVFRNAESRKTSVSISEPPVSEISLERGGRCELLLPKELVAALQV